jgi:hypothetical protein
LPPEKRINGYLSYYDMEENPADVQSLKCRKMVFFSVLKFEAIKLIQLFLPAGIDRSSKWRFRAPRRIIEK